MNYLRLITGLILCLAVTATHAVKLPANYPAGFSHAGVIEDVDIGHRFIVIGDTKYPIAEVVLVHEADGRVRELSQQDIGLEIGIIVHSILRGSVREAWILPRGYLSSFRPRWVE